MPKRSTKRSSQLKERLKAISAFAVLANPQKRAEHQAQRDASESTSKEHWFPGRRRPVGDVDGPRMVIDQNYDDDDVMRAPVIKYARTLQD